MGVFPPVFTVLLVCTGNICRSPMAFGFLRQLLRERGITFIPIQSAGVQAWDDSPPTPEAVEALRERGIDISIHLARRLNRGLIEDADLVLAMSAEHRDATQRIVPATSDRTFTLKEFVQLLESTDSQDPPRMRSKPTRDITPTCSWSARTPTTTATTGFT